MPRMKKTMKAADAPGKDLPKIPIELIDCFVTGPMSAEAVMAEAQVCNKAIYLALAVLPDGTRDMPGLWIEQTEGTKFTAFVAKQVADWQPAIKAADLKP